MNYESNDLKRQTEREKKEKWRRDELKEKSIHTSILYGLGVKNCPLCGWPPSFNHSFTDDGGIAYIRCGNTYEEEVNGEMIYRQQCGLLLYRKYIAGPGPYCFPKSLETNLDVITRWNGLRFNPSPFIDDSDPITSVWES